MRKNFLQVADEELAMDYGYLVMDCTPSMPCDVQVCTNIFPGETTYMWNL